METIVLYYSHTGNTKALAQAKAVELGCDIEQIAEARKRGVLAGLFSAVKRQGAEIVPLNANLDDYEKIVLMSPVWASHPVSAVNSVIDLLPAGKGVEVIMVSGGRGTKSTAEQTKQRIFKRECIVTGYTDVKAKSVNGQVVAVVLP